MNQVATRTNDIAVYDPFRQQLAELKSHSNSMVFDYSDPKGNKEARSHIYKLRQTKAAVEKARKDEKAEVLVKGRKIDSEANSIIDDIEALIEVHQKPLDEIEAKESARIKAIETRLETLIDAIGANLELDAAELSRRLAYVESVAIDDTWMEFAASAAKQKDTSVTALREKLAKRQKYDAEQAELANLRAQQVAREQADRDAAIAREATEKAEKEAAERARREQAARDAEHARQLEEANKREQQARIDAESAARREAEAKLEKERAEQRAREQVELAAKQERERIERETREREERERQETEKREANRKHCAAINNAAKDSLVNECGITADQAIKVIQMIASKKIPSVTITY